MVENIIVEKKAINYLSDLLLNTEIVDPRINEGDKYPSWDGELLVYKSNRLDKNNLLGRVPVQIKAHLTEKPFEAQIPFDYEVSDLKNYLQDGGVFYFVVYFTKSGSFMVYYDELLPLDLKKMLQNVGAKKTIRKKLKRIPNNKSDILILHLKNFILNKPRQGNLVYKESSLIDVSKENIKNIDKYCFHMVDFCKNKDFLEQAVYLYAKPKGFDVEIPIEKGYLSEITAKRNDIEICLGTTSYYLPIELKQTKNNKTIKIGKSFIIDLDAQKCNFKIQGTLSERIRDMKFGLKIARGEKIKFKAGGLPEWEFLIKKGKSKLLELALPLRFLRKIDTFLKYLNVEKDLELDNISNEEINMLDMLMKTYDKKETMSLPNNDYPIFGRFEIGNIVLAVGLKRVGDCSYKVFDLFGYNEISKGFIFESEDGQKFPCSAVVMLKKENLVEFSNLNFIKMIKAVESVAYSYAYCERVANLGLEAIAAYDICEDRRLLDFANSLYLWVLKNEPNNTVATLNIHQIIKRQRNFTENETSILIELKNKTVDNMELLGISILLSNRPECIFYFNKLSPKEQKRFKTLPICKLWERDINGEYK